MLLLQTQNFLWNFPRGLIILSVTDSQSYLISHWLSYCFWTRMLALLKAKSPVIPQGDSGSPDLKEERKSRGLCPGLASQGHVQRVTWWDTPTQVLTLCLNLPWARAWANWWKWQVWATHRAFVGSGAGQTAGRGRLQCASVSCGSAQTSGKHSWCQCGPEGVKGGREWDEKKTLPPSTDPIPR